MWATRCTHEARKHEENSFITLTYEDSQLPHDGSLVKKHLQDFMKALRHYAKRKHNIDGIKFFACGEYGEEFKRPHYHACIFGLDWQDKKIHSAKDDYNVYRSDILDGIWRKGFTTTGDVTFDSAGYCARYALKKINGDAEKIPDPKTGLLPYERIHAISGEIITVEKEFATMSRRPGIGHDHWHNYRGDIYPSDECIINGHPTRPPRYYDNLLEIHDPDMLEEVKQTRVETMQKHAADNTRARLRQRKIVKEAQTQKLTREIS